MSAPELLTTLSDRWHEGWLGSPAVADIDGDGTRDILVPRGNKIINWQPDGSIAWEHEAAGGRIWASPVVGNFVGDAALEIAYASRENVYLLDSAGSVLPGFPVSWDDELRSIAAGDLDGDGDLEIVVAPARGGPTDVMMAWHGDGSVVSGFPPLGSGSSGCDGDDKCYLAGCFDQNLAVGDLDGDGKHDVVAPHDNAYASIHKGTGEAFDADSGFSALKTPGVRYLHDLSEAQQGWAPNEDTALQAHFTNTAPAIADVDGDGTPEVILLGSVQNAAQSSREQGVALWVVRPDVTRPAGWDPPVHFASYQDGLWDYGDNIVGITNQVAVADIDPDRAGPEFLFADFGGHIQAVSATGEKLWSFDYAVGNAETGTGGVLAADLTGDGSPEVVFASYSHGMGGNALYILDAGGNLQQSVDLPTRGAMPVPTIADVDGNGTLEIVVSLKDAEDRVESVRIYTLPGSGTNCLLWPTGRGNLLRNGWVND